MQEVAKLCRLVDGRPRIISDPPLLVPMEELLPRQEDAAEFESQLLGLIATYRRTLETDRRFLFETFRYADLARKVVGVGSVGTRCWILLMFGRDESDPLFLQVKEAQTSVLSRFVGASKYTNQGQRVVAGQRLMQASSDIFLGWQRTEIGLDGQQRDFYVRQLRDWKYSLPIEAMVPRGMRAYGERAGGHWPAPTPAPATGSLSPRTWAARTSSTRPSPVRRRLRRPERARPPISPRRCRRRADNRRARPVRPGARRLVEIPQSTSPCRCQCRGLPRRRRGP